MGVPVWQRRVVDALPGTNSSKEGLSKLTIAWLGCRTLLALVEVELVTFGAFSLALEERIDATSSEAFAPANSPPEFARLKLQPLSNDAPAPFIQPFQELLLALAHGIAHQAAMFAKDVRNPSRICQRLRTLIEGFNWYTTRVG